MEALEPRFLLTGTGANDSGSLPPLASSPVPVVVPSTSLVIPPATPGGVEGPWPLSALRPGDGAEPVAVTATSTSLGPSSAWELSYPTEFLGTQGGVALAPTASAVGATALAVKPNPLSLPGGTSGSQTAGATVPTEATATGESPSLATAASAAIPASGRADDWGSFPVTWDSSTDGGPSLAPDLQIAGPPASATASSSVAAGPMASTAQTASTQTSLVAPTNSQGTAGQTSPRWPGLTTHSVAVVTVPSGPSPAQGSSAQDQEGGGWLVLTTEDQASAQFLPAQPRVSVFANLSAADPEKVFEIPDDSRTHDLGIELAPLGLDPNAPPVEMAVFDASGRKLADSSISSGPDAQVISMNVTLDQASSSPGVYVKIATAPGAFGPLSSSSTAASESFVLQVTRGPDAVSTPLVWGEYVPAQVRVGDGSSPAGVGAQSGAGSAAAATVSMSTESDVPETIPGGVLVVSSAPLGQSQTVTSSTVATGPLPERAGAPLGGVLAEGDPVPQIDRNDPALVDLALIGLPEPERLPGLGEADREAIVADVGPSQEEAGGLVMVRGTGGFPLLAASARGAGMHDPEALAAALPPVAAATLTAAPAPTAVPGQPALEPQPQPHSRPRSGPAAPMLSGLTVAVTMIFSLVRPEMTRLMTPRATPRFKLGFRSRRPPAP